MKTCYSPKYGFPNVDVPAEKLAFDSLLRFYNIPDVSADPALKTAFRVVCSLSLFRGTTFPFLYQCTDVFQELSYDAARHVLSRLSKDGMICCCPVSQHCDGYEIYRKIYYPTKKGWKTYCRELGIAYEEPRMDGKCLHHSTSVQSLGLLMSAAGAEGAAGGRGGEHMFFNESTRFFEEKLLLWRSAETGEVSNYRVGRSTVGSINVDFGFETVPEGADGAKFYLFGEADCNTERPPVLWDKLNRYILNSGYSCQDTGGRANPYEPLTMSILMSVNTRESGITREDYRSFLSLPETDTICRQLRGLDGDTAFPCSKNDVQRIRNIEELYLSLNGGQDLPMGDFLRNYYSAAKSGADLVRFHLYHSYRQRLALSKLSSLYRTAMGFYDTYKDADWVFLSGIAKALLSGLRVWFSGFGLCGDWGGFLYDFSRYAGNYERLAETLFRGSDAHWEPLCTTLPLPEYGGTNLGLRNSVDCLTSKGSRQLMFCEDVNDLGSWVRLAYCLRHPTEYAYGVVLFDDEWQKDILLKQIPEAASGTKYCSVLWITRSKLLSI